MTIAVTGAGGQLGSEICRRLPDAVGLTRAEMDLSDRESIERAIGLVSPTAVINAAAYTAVDKAEEDAESCNAVNGEAVGAIADMCQDLQIPLVQVSTDYVYERSTQRSPHREADVAEHPVGVYATSKLIGEANARRCDQHFVVRTCGLYSVAEDGPIRGRNFVDTMIALGTDRSELSVVADQHCTPTFVPDLVDAIAALLDCDQYGVYHVTNSGETTWYEFAQEIFRLAQLDIELTPITTDQYGAPAPRPPYSVLDVSKYTRATRKPLRDWKPALADYFKSMREGADAITQLQHSAE